MIPLFLPLSLALVGQNEAVGERPYEMVWAGRDAEVQPALADFEDLTGWTVECHNAVGTMEGNRERLMYGEQVGKVTYRGTSSGPTVRLVPPRPVPCPDGFDTVSLWVYGNQWSYSTDPTTPAVTISAIFAAADGTEVPVQVLRVNAKYWFLAYRKLTADQAAKLARGATLKAIEIAGGTNKDDRSLWLDSLCAFREELKPLSFPPRPKWGIDPFPGQDPGVFTGPGKLPFPTRAQTILPANLTDRYKTEVKADGDAFTLTYRGEDGVLTYRLTPKTGTFSDLTAQFTGRGGEFRPGDGGGVRFAGDGDVPVPPEALEHRGTRLEGDSVVSHWWVRHGERSADVTYTYRLWQKSLVIDVHAAGGQLAEVRYGEAVGLDRPRVFQVPYLANSAGRAHAVIAGPAERPLFLMGHPCWYLSGASEIFGAGAVTGGRATYYGGTRYKPKTDGRRNDVYERLFLTVSPRFEEVLPTVANPVSPWKDVTGTGVWRAHGASNRDSDAAFWRKAHRYGLRHVIVTDHETGWRDEGESFTFRTRPAPKKGGDEGQVKYARVMQDELGFVYGPYNNYTDFAPVNEYWSPDRINRLPDGQLQQAWSRCYAPKAVWAVEMCARLAPEIQKKFQFSTAYCDVHTAVTPWSRTDYDARAPGAGTFAAVFYSYGEIMGHQKQAWNGPVYSEGNHHCYLHGLTDGNYAQDQAARLPANPWLVDFDLLKLHDLGCNFGMGSPGMFYGRGFDYGRTPEEKDFTEDRFLAATIAFGHPGFLTFEGGYHNALRSYYMVQQLAAAYTRESVASIRYVDAAGNLLDTSTALARDQVARCQVVNTYRNGTVTVVNGSLTEPLKVTVGTRQLALPPAGYAGWTADGAVEVFAGLVDGHRIDYAATPEYLYLDGRGRFTRLPQAAGDGIGICRREGDGWEIIPYLNASCGFAVGGGQAVALDQAGQEIGPAEVRLSRGLTYVMPVDKAFSYRFTPVAVTAVALRCDRSELIPGEAVTVRGQQDHPYQAPADAKPGDRLWFTAEGGWIDFTVVPLAAAELTLAGNALTLALTPNVPAPTEATASLRGVERALRLAPRTAQTVTVDLGAPKSEGVEEVPFALRAGKLTLQRSWTLRTIKDIRKLAELPDGYQTGIRLRGQPETTDFGGTRAIVTPRTMVCGDVSRKGLFMHPPWTGGVGATYAQFDPVTLPQAPPAAVRCYVGKLNGSDLGDGILFLVVVVAEDGTETEVARQLVEQHEWLPVTGDLTRWRGQKVRIKLIADVGEADNSSGDWACFADYRIESLNEELTRALTTSDGRFGLGPAPYPVANLTLAQLRAAKQGWLRYDGKGLSGTGAYESFGLLNGLKLGNLAPAGGGETQGIFAEKVGVPLTAEAIAGLVKRNVVRVLNPRRDSFSIGRFWLELELADGRKASSLVSTAIFTQPSEWLYAEGIGVPFSEDISVEVWFDLSE